MGITNKDVLKTVAIDVPNLKTQIEDIIGNSTSYPNIMSDNKNGLISLIDFDLANNPVMTKYHITDIQNVNGVADPFIVYNNGMYYMFFEAISTRGSICYATSVNGLDWKYGSQVLKSDTIHYAFPNVFKADGKWYMLCDNGGYTQGMSLYTTDTFPVGWKKDVDLFTSGKHIDPTLFKYNDKWYYISYDSDTYQNTLWYSDDFRSGSWTRHPSSPITTGVNVRCGGRPMVYKDKVNIFMQYQGNYYGEKLYLYTITNLSPTTCTITKSNQPVLKPSGKGWNKIGMHHADIMFSDGLNSFAVVDGLESGENWSIGIYALGTELTTSKNTTNLPVNEYTFENVAGNYILDTGSRMQNAVIQNVTIKTGNIGNCIVTGSNKHLNCNINNYKSLSFWINPLQLSDAYNIVFLGGNNDSYILQHAKRKGTIAMHNGSIYSNELPYSFNLNTYYHIVLNQTSDTTTDVYINNSKIGTFNMGLMAITRIGGGMSSPSMEYFAGEIDQFRVYNDILTSTDIENLYNE